MIGLIKNTSDTFQEAFDVACAMYEEGDDILLSPRAEYVFTPIEVECKSETHEYFGDSEWRPRLISLKGGKATLQRGSEENIGKIISQTNIINEKYDLASDPTVIISIWHTRVGKFETDLLVKPNSFAYEEVYDYYQNYNNTFSPFENVEGYI